ncbi:Homocysteine S-methyltransferase [Melia azedarach]|uniref:Homocysteine S-methyltransferase n=1 Tax=Melia azedarach TaxID=155640 RepID=A0ACC1YW84_MELAZ|nr:Homocysteine S-methyltransferase [Melia azedarach]
MGAHFEYIPTNPTKLSPKLAITQTQVKCDGAAAETESTMSSSLMTDFLRQTGGAAVIDGGLATELERHGADLNDPLWSAKCLLTSPHLIRKASLFSISNYIIIRVL